MKNFTVIFDDSSVYYVGRTEDTLKVLLINGVEEKDFDTYDEMLDFVNKLEEDN